MRVRILRICMCNTYMQAYISPVGKHSRCMVIRSMPNVAVSQAACCVSAYYTFGGGGIMVPRLYSYNVGEWAMKSVSEGIRKEAAVALMGYHPVTFLNGPRNLTKILSQNSRCFGSDSSQVSPQYECLTLPLRQSALCPKLLNILCLCIFIINFTCSVDRSRQKAQ
jgi:hypothetical protein